MSKTTIKPNPKKAGTTHESINKNIVAIINAYLGNDVFRENQDFEELRDIIEKSSADLSEIFGTQGLRDFFDLLAGISLSSSPQESKQKLLQITNLSTQTNSEELLKFGIKELRLGALGLEQTKNILKIASCVKLSGNNKADLLSTTDHRIYHSKVSLKTSYEMIQNSLDELLKNTQMTREDTKGMGAIIAGIN